jgi:hypothetical protein
MSSKKHLQPPENLQTKRMGEKSWKTPPRAGGVEWVGVLAARFAWWGKYPRSGSDALLCGTTALLSPGLQSGVSEANE